MDMHTTLISNLYHLKYVQFYNFRKVLIILTNDSSDSNHQNLSSKFTLSVAVAFIKKKNNDT